MIYQEILLNYFSGFIFICPSPYCFVFIIGVIRLVHYLSQHHIFGKDQALKVVLDSGTGTTAVGLGIAALCLG